ncbi:MAG TPA: hypothetical protein ENG42_02800 [Candidatus Aenigmarchaeota archaeon]|nr:hypothetical protein [Candidatus Aenigmarchaeota archaeon]
MNGDFYSAQQEEIEKMKKEILMKILSKEAMERLGRVRTVNPYLAAQVELYLIQLYKEGQVKDVISDSKLKTILELLSTKRDFKIKRF